MLILLLIKNNILIVFIINVFIILGYFSGFSCALNWNHFWQNFVLSADLFEIHQIWKALRIRKNL